MSKHTPGPWVAEPEYEGDPANYVHKDGRGIADCAQGYGAEDEANARLIAAAPDMLAALKKLVEIIDSPFDGEILAPTRNRAFAIIAKAEGRHE